MTPTEIYVAAFTDVLEDSFFSNHIAINHIYDIQDGYKEGRTDGYHIATFLRKIQHENINTN